uniref:Uncharacterized protein n=1 Tax=Fagus sylvatica TaxID=28930 RepID=A0A2N9IVQ0_FAGSY
MQADTRIFQLEQHCGQCINLPKQPNVVNGCHNVKMHCVKFIASGNNPNTDDIHVQLSSSVTILNSKIRTGDDCLSIGPGTTNFIGSLGKDQQEAGVQNLTVKTVTFTGTQNGSED